MLPQKEPFTRSVLKQDMQFYFLGVELEQSPSHTSGRCARGDFVDN